MSDKRVDPAGPVAPAKLPRLPPYARIQKRPLMHPPIPSPYRGRDARKTVYISPKTPFISAVKRVRRLLKEADKRATQSALACSRKRNRQRTDYQHNDPIMAAAQASVDRVDVPESVSIKATGRAIEEATKLALFFQQQHDCRITMRTGTVDAIDDVTERPGAERGESDSGEALPETRKRKTSMLEVIVTLR